MSIKETDSSQTKLIQIFEQLKVLAKNVEELTAEIRSLRNNAVLDDKRLSASKESNGTRSAKGGIKKFAKKVTGLVKWKKEKAPITNPRGKLNEDKNIIDRNSQTDETDSHLKKKKSVGKHKNVRLKKSQENQKQTEKNRMQVAKFDERSKESGDSQKDLSVTSVSSNEVTPPRRKVQQKYQDPNDFSKQALPSNHHNKDSPKPMQIPRNDKIRKRGRSDDDEISEIRGKQNYHHPRAKNRKLYIYNAESDNIKNHVECIAAHPYPKNNQFCTNYTCGRARGKMIAENLDSAKPSKKLYTKRHSSKRKNASAVKNDKVSRDFRKDEAYGDSSTSISVDMEVDVSDVITPYDKQSKNESQRKRKPKMYVINKRNKEYNQNWVDQVEEITVCTTKPSSGSSLTALDSEDKMAGWNNKKLPLKNAANKKSKTSVKTSTTNLKKFSRLCDRIKVFSGRKCPKMMILRPKESINRLETVFSKCFYHYRKSSSLSSSNTETSLKSEDNGINKRDNADPHIIQNQRVYTALIDAEPREIYKASKFNTNINRHCCKPSFSGNEFRKDEVTKKLYACLRKLNNIVD